MADAGMRSRAAAYVDAQFSQARASQVQEQQRQERRMMAFHKAQLQSWQRNRDIAELRHMQRVKSIDARQERAGAAMDKRHNSLGGRMAALTRQGRARQADERQALADRGDALRITAHRNLEALKERQFQGQQADRIMRAREMKLHRQEFADARQQQDKIHHQTRDHKIEMRVQAMGLQAKQEQSQQLRQKQPLQMKKDFDQARPRSPKQEFKHAGRTGADQERHLQQQQPQQQEAKQQQPPQPKQEFQRAGRGRSMG